MAAEVNQEWSNSRKKVERFRKSNSSAFTDSLLREEEGLEALRTELQTRAIKDLHIPQVFAVDERELILQAIQPQRPQSWHWQCLGNGLAELHRNAKPFYGFSCDNYIGLAPQCNTASNSWGEFFVQHRLRFQLQRVRDSRLARDWNKLLDRAAPALTAFLDNNCTQPSLVHGDLWSGNVMFDQHNAWLIDPAVYFGDREVDLAMSEMFGGFDPIFYRAYDETLPRSENYPLKRTVYNLYHYLNHYNLFGSGYRSACDEGFAALIHF